MVRVLTPQTLGIDAGTLNHGKLTCSRQCLLFLAQARNCVGGLLGLELVPLDLKLLKGPQVPLEAPNSEA